MEFLPPPPVAVVVPVPHVTSLHALRRRSKQACPSGVAARLTCLRLSVASLRDLFSRSSRTFLVGGEGEGTGHLLQVRRGHASAAVLSPPPPPRVPLLLLLLPPIPLRSCLPPPALPRMRQARMEPALTMRTSEARVV